MSSRSNRRQNPSRTPAPPPSRGRRVPETRSAVAPRSGPRGPPLRAGPTTTAVPQRRLFIAAIGVSGFLLFSLELLAGRLVLPTFGGTPGVWATTLCFFTAIVFVGYVYAHTVATRLSPRRAGLVQVGLAAAAVVFTIVGPSDVSTLRNPGIPEAINVLLVVGLIGGAAGFVLSTTTPLLSTWIDRRGPIRGGSTRSPTGPASSRSSPTRSSSSPSSPCLPSAAPRRRRARRLRRAHRCDRAERSSRRDPGDGRCGAGNTPGHRTPPAGAVARRAMVPAGLLAATTNFLQTDLIASPFIWVGPLGIYLLEPGWSPSRGAAAGCSGSSSDSCRPLRPCSGSRSSTRAAGPRSGSSSVELGTLFVLAVAIHGRLAADRPETAELTRFYVILSAGGVLATAFVALLAPILFNDTLRVPRC